jgi:hypothetical protein
MAESIKSRAKRYSKGKFTRNELLTLIGIQLADKAIDIATFGQVARLQGKALYNLVIPAVSTTGRLAGRAALGTARVLGSSALQGTIGAATPLVQSAAFPYAAGAALGYGALQTQPGQQLLESAEERGRMDRIRFEQALTDVTVRAKKTKSKFNRAVSAGMKAAKASTSYGKKGVINAPKKVFSTVTKMASNINKARQGIRRMPVPPKPKGPRSLFNAIKKVLK